MARDNRVHDLGFGVMVYPGLNLATSYAQPFWDSPLLPWLFVIAGMLTGIVAAGLYCSPLTKTVDECRRIMGEVHGVASWLPMLKLLVLFCFIGHGGTLNPFAFYDVFTGVLAPWLWGGVILIGIIIPLLLGFYVGRLRAAKNWPRVIGVSTLSFILMLIGASLFMRYTIMAVVH